MKSINSIEKGNICLTFDDGPDSTMTPKILDVLQKYNVQANFFLIGKASQNNQDIVKRIHLEGHIIGCHTFCHKTTFPMYSLSRMEAELVKTNNLIKSITSEEVLLFRPPFGITNPLRDDETLTRAHFHQPGTAVLILRLLNPQLYQYNFQH